MNKCLQIRLHESLNQCAFLALSLLIFDISVSFLVHWFATMNSEISDDSHQWSLALTQHAPLPEKLLNGLQKTRAVGAYRQPSIGQRLDVSQVLAWGGVCLSVFALKGDHASDHKHMATSIPD